MGLIGGIVFVVAILVLAIALGSLAHNHPNPTYTRPDAGTDISEREWSDAIK